MNIVTLICRLLLGLAFTVFGLNGFLHFIPTPPMTGLVADFTTVLAASHYYVVIFGVQLLCGIALLVNRYVPLAIVTLAAVLVNIFTFHITMQPAGLPPAIIAGILWFVVAWPLRAHFAPLFVQKAD